MKKKKVGKWILLLITVLAILIVLIVKNKLPESKESEEILVKDNVTVFSSEMPEEERPYSVEENRLLFKQKPQISIGDVIVSGITEEAPNGYIRKVVNIEDNNGVFICETEPATLLDVFEEVHFSETILLVDQEEYASNTYETSELLVMNGDFISESFTQSNQGFSVQEDRDNDNLDDLISVKFKGEVDEDIQIEGSAGVKIWLNVQLDIKNGHIDWEITANDRIHGKLLLGFSDSVKKEFAKKLMEKELPPIQFMVGIIPIVITNEVQVQLEGECSLEGEVGTSMEIYETHTAGFQYISKTDTLREINSQNFRTGGMNWSTGMGVKGSASAGVFVYLQSMLYDCTGANIAIGVEGKAEGEAKMGAYDAGKSVGPIGKITMSIYPQLKGNVVIDIPIICKDMKEIPLYEQSLSPFWSKTWSEEELEAALEKVESEEDIFWEKFEEPKEAEVDTDESTSLGTKGNMLWYELYTQVINGIDLEYEDTDSYLYSFTGRHYYDAELVYYLRYFSDSVVPDLCIGAIIEENTMIVAIYDLDVEDGEVYARRVVGLSPKNIIEIGLCTNDGLMYKIWGNVMFFDANGNNIGGTMDMVIDPNTLDWTPIEEW